MFLQLISPFDKVCLPGAYPLDFEGLAVMYCSDAHELVHNDD